MDLPVPTQPEVHEALTHLNDSVKLAQTSLMACFPQLQQLPQLDERAQKLCALLLEAIESLCPSRPAPFGSLDSRAYEVLTLRYVERMSTADMAEELSLSRRQVHRDLKLAEERLTELLASWVRPAANTPEVATEKDSMSEELALFSVRSSEMPLCALMEEALALVRPLADELQVSIRTPDPAAIAQPVVGNRALLRQLITQTLSLAIQSAQLQTVVVGSRQSSDATVITVEFSVADPASFPTRLDEIQRIAQLQGIGCAAEIHGWEHVIISLTFRHGNPMRVLVIEDNPGAVELYRRYLSPTDWQVESVSDPRLCYDLARTLKPHLVILDIMMPHVDGWTLLRTLKDRPETRDIPVVVCSIIRDPALGKALGAKAYLTKPISQAELLLALHRCLE